MVVRTMLPYTKVVRKPRIQEIPANPQTLIDHLLKVRLKRGLSQHAVGRLLGLSKDCVSLWETGKFKPLIYLYPKILAFIGYYPFIHETESIAGKLQQLLNCNGWSHKEAAKALGIDSGTVKRILHGQKTLKKNDNIILRLWSLLPDYLKQPYRLL